MNEHGSPPDDLLVFPDADGGYQSGPAVSARYVEARELLDRAFGFESDEARIARWIASAPSPEQLRLAGHDELADALGVRAAQEA